MKKILMILCCLIMCVSFGGCSRKEKDKNDNYTTIGDRVFFVISDESVGESWNIYVDTETKVQYIVFNGDHSYTATMSILVDSDGKPILYEGSVLDE